MTIETFNPPIPPSPGTTQKSNAKVRAAEFGNGYTPRSADGLNNVARNLSLTWEYLLPDQSEEIISFFETKGGDTPFLYTPSNESTPVQWRCTDWSEKRIKGGIRTVSATFEESFDIYVELAFNNPQMLDFSVETNSQYWVVTF